MYKSTRLAPLTPYMEQCIKEADAQLAQDYPQCVVTEEGQVRADQILDGLIRRLTMDAVWVMVCHLDRSQEERDGWRDLIQALKGRKVRALARERNRHRDGAPFDLVIETSYQNIPPLPGSSMPVQTGPPTATIRIVKQTRADEDAVDRLLSRYEQPPSTPEQPSPSHTSDHV